MSAAPPTQAPVSVLNVPGLDRRRMDAETMPFLDSLVRSGTMVEWDGHPTTEIWPTLVTGANPGQHWIWHCKLADQGKAKGFQDSLLEKLPDRLVATGQIFRHFVDRDFDMPCIPHRRRRHLEFHRLKFNARSKPEQYRNVGGVDTLFGALGDKAEYGVTGQFEELEKMLTEWPRESTDLDWLEVHCYDIAVHYNVHKDEVMKQRGKELDDFAKAYHDKCRKLGRKFILIADHGQEPVADSVNLEKLLKRTGVDPSEFVHFTAQGVAKFWFRTKESRKRIEEALRASEHLNVMDWKELNERFDFELDEEWGELYAIADSGYVFFPHDFHHLLAHLHLGLTNPAMRSRLWSFNVAAYHGQMPGHPAERGFMVSDDPELKLRAENDELVRIVDVAPTLLSLVGENAMPHMKGRVVMDKASHDGTQDSSAVA